MRRVERPRTAKLFHYLVRDNLMTVQFDAAMNYAMPDCIECPACNLIDLRFRALDLPLRSASDRAVRIEHSELDGRRASIDSENAPPHSLPIVARSQGGQTIVLCHLPGVFEAAISAV